MANGEHLAVAAVRASSGLWCGVPLEVFRTTHASVLHARHAVHQLVLMMAHRAQSGQLHKELFRRKQQVAVYSLDPYQGSSLAGMHYCG